MWLGSLRPDLDRNVMHSGKSAAFENAIGKLYEFGLRKRIGILDEKTEPFRRWSVDKSNPQTKDVSQLSTGL